MNSNAQQQVEITGSSAKFAAITLVGNLQASIVLDAGWNIHLQSLLHLTAAFTCTRTAGKLTGISVSITVWTRAARREYSRDSTVLATSSTPWTGSQGRGGFSSKPFAFRAGFHLYDLNRLVNAGCGLVNGEGEFVTEIRSLQRTPL
jgi:hypothetical protein